MLMMIEMVGYTALHTAGEERWRCILCPGMEQFSEKDLRNHLISNHGITDEDLKSEHGGEMFLYPSKDAETTN
jgi:hypothetical protein